MSEPIPDKGRVLTAMSAFWFEHFAGVVASHLISTDLDDAARAGARVPELAGRVDAVPRAEMLPIECIVRGYITGSAWKEYRSRRAPCTARRCPPGCSSRRRCPSRCSPRRPRPDERPRREHLLRAGRRPGRRRAGRAGPRACRSSCYRQGAELGRRARHHHRRHQVRAGPRRRRAGRVRRGAHARTRRASGRPTSGRPAPTPPSFDKQPRARLPRRPRLGQAARRRPPLPAEVVKRHERPLRRGLRAHHRPLVRRLARRRLSPAGGGHRSPTGWAERWDPLHHGR